MVKSDQHRSTKLNYIASIFNRIASIELSVEVMSQVFLWKNSTGIIWNLFCYNKNILKNTITQHLIYNIQGKALYLNSVLGKVFLLQRQASPLIKVRKWQYIHFNMTARKLKLINNYHPVSFGVNTFIYLYLSFGFLYMYNFPVLVFYT